MGIPEGLCQCGCGRRTVGKFISGHNSKGENNPAWNGGIKIKTTGRVLIWVPDHPRADSQGYVRRSILIVEKALRHSLPLEAKIHHVNCNESDDSRGNLVVCEDQAYHLFLHQRKRAHDDCGHADWKRCRRCGHYSPKEEMRTHDERSNSWSHPECVRKYSEICRQRRGQQKQGVSLT